MNPLDPAVSAAKTMRATLSLRSTSLYAFKKFSIVLAADGKSRTLTMKGTTPDGTKVETMFFYDKQ